MQPQYAPIFFTCLLCNSSPVASPGRAQETALRAFYLALYGRNRKEVLPEVPRLLQAVAGKLSGGGWSSRCILSHFGARLTLECRSMVAI